MTYPFTVMFTSTRIGTPSAALFDSRVDSSSGFELFTVAMNMKSGAADDMLDGSRMTPNSIWREGALNDEFQRGNAFITLRPAGIGLPISHMSSLRPVLSGCAPVQIIGKF